MLFNPHVIGFESLYDNFGASYTESGLGTAVVADLTAHTKSAVVEIFSGATIQKDCYGVGLIALNGSSNGAARRYLLDIMVDPAGGTNWQVLIPNLLFNGPGFGCFRYYFPIRIKAGSSVGARMQCNVGGEDMRIALQLFGGPSHAGQMKFGTFVEAFGVNEANTDGVSITPGNDVMGSWVSLGTTNKELWFWQCGGLASDDATQSNQIMFQDVAAGDASTKHLLINKCIQRRTSAEQCSKDAYGIGLPIRSVPSGTTIYSRAASTAPDTAETTTAYGVG